MSRVTRYADATQRFTVQTVADRMLLDVSNGEVDECASELRFARSGAPGVEMGVVRTLGVVSLIQWLSVINHTAKQRVVGMVGGGGESPLNVDSFYA